MSVHARAPAYPQAKVEEEEDVKGHIDLQREVFVEVLAGFYRTGEQRHTEREKTTLLQG